ncbi:hypothetical protein ACVBIL_07245 [Shewanella sp. 125m-7]
MKLPIQLLVIALTNMLSACANQATAPSAKLNAYFHDEYFTPATERLGAEELFDLPDEAVITLKRLLKLALDEQSHFLSTLNTLAVLYRYKGLDQEAEALYQYTSSIKHQASSINP